MVGVVKGKLVLHVAGEAWSNTHFAKTVLDVTGKYRGSEITNHSLVEYVKLMERGRRIKDLCTVSLQKLVGIMPQL